jgi:hypothetical protein
MPTYRVAGISVQFPYDAYDCQLVYMERVISSLQQVWIKPQTLRMFWVTKLRIQGPLCEVLGKHSITSHGVVLSGTECVAGESDRDGEDAVLAVCYFSVA